jgi:Zn-dependent protease with chaperone function
MGFVFRRSLPSMVGLVALLVGVGFAAMVQFDLPLWFPGMFGIGMVVLQYLVNPWLIERLVPATIVDLDAPAGTDPAGPDERITAAAALVARRCKDSGVPAVKLGIVDDGTPNAFTFGHHPKDARVWLTRGLLERLDDDELDAVVTHELGHIRHWDFVVMTVASAVPLVLYLIYVVARGARKQGYAVAAVAYVAYLISQFVLLALSRARELGADHWSCECTGNGDALASALVKVAYGMGQAQADLRDELAELRRQAKSGGKEAKKAAARRELLRDRAHAIHALGIFDPSQVRATEAVLVKGLDPDHAVSALRWDIVHPWGATLEKLSSHPLVARRIEALERSGLPGAPKRWSVLRAIASVPPAERATLRSRWVTELAITLAPTFVLLGLTAFGLFRQSVGMIGLALASAGALLVVKQLLRYPTTTFEDVDEVAGLLDRLDAGPVRGIPVTVRGELVGRATPGYRLSPHLVLADDSGFVPLVYRQPLPFAGAWFGLARAQKFLGREVVARGWYRRGPSPVVELRTAVAAGGDTIACWEWTARYVGSALLLVAGLFLIAAGA